MKYFCFSWNCVHALFVRLSVNRPISICKQKSRSHPSEEWRLRRKMNISRMINAATDCLQTFLCVNWSVKSAASKTIIFDSKPGKHRRILRRRQLGRKQDPACAVQFHRIKIQGWHWYVRTCPRPVRSMTLNGLYREPENRCIWGINHVSLRAYLCPFQKAIMDRLLYFYTQPASFNHILCTLSTLWAFERVRHCTCRIILRFTGKGCHCKTETPRRSGVATWWVRIGARSGRHVTGRRRRAAS